MTDLSTDDRPPVGFIIGGVQKGGTTTLYAALRRHSQIAQAKPKELHYFDDERRDWTNPDYGAYERRFNYGATSRIAGEATPSYLFWPHAIERIREYNPKMKLIFSFRDPVERAFSQWCMNKSGYPDETPSFGAAIREFAPEGAPGTPTGFGGRRRSYVIRGFYGAQICQVQDAFPADQLLLLDFHRTFNAWDATIDRTTDFLGLDRFHRRRIQKHRRAQPTDLTGEPPSADDITFLVHRYADDLEVFASRTGIDVSQWTTTAVAGGRLEAGSVAEKLASRAGLTAA